MTITEGAFRHIESEIRDYDSTLEELDILEKSILGKERLTIYRNGSMVALQAKYNHLIEVLKSINQAFDKLSEEQKRVIESIYRSAQKKELTPEEEKCRNDFVNQIAIFLGWR
jgi:hypothetical protein